ncbi:hypothetical protein GCM10023324_05220 [Streptomyces youssoufiensis]
MAVRQFHADRAALSTEQRHGADRYIRYLHTKREFPHCEKTLASAADPFEVMAFHGLRAAVV